MGLTTYQFYKFNKNPYLLNINEFNLFIQQNEQLKLNGTNYLKLNLYDSNLKLFDLFMDNKYPLLCEVSLINDIDNNYIINDYINIYNENEEQSDSSSSSKDQKSLIKKKDKYIEIYIRVPKDLIKKYLPYYFKKDSKQYTINYLKEQEQELFNLIIKYNIIYTITIKEKDDLGKIQSINIPFNNYMLYYKQKYDSLGYKQYYYFILK